MDHDYQFDADADLASYNQEHPEGPKPKPDHSARILAIEDRICWLRLWNSLTGANVLPDIIRLQTERKKLERDSGVTNG